MQAPAFNTINPSTDLVFSPPYLPQSLPRTVKARGSVRLASTNRDVVVTGPEMKVLFGGCKYDSLVMDPDISLETWLGQVHDALERAVKADPLKFKCTPGREPVFEFSAIQASTNAELYSDKLWMRLATIRTGSDINDQKVVAVFVDKDNKTVEPANIQRNGKIVPIFKVNYYRGYQDVYSVTLTLVKALYEAPPDSTIDNMEWEFDHPASD